MTAPYKGGCSCGAIRYTVNAEPLISYCCHCTECQKRTSSAFGISAMVPADSLVIEQGTPKGHDRKGDSGNELTTMFCGECGSSLFSVPAARPQIRVLYAGTLDDPAWVPIQLNIWTGSKLPWVPLDAGVPNEPAQPNMGEYIAKLKQ